MGSCYLRSGTKSWLWATPRFTILVLASVGWLAGCGGGGSDGAPAPVVTMPPEPERVNLSISKIGADQGVLTAHIGSEAIGSCGLNCAELSLHVPIGALLRLEAQATTGASLWSWGSLPCRTHETRCEFEMVEDRAPDVTFTRVTVTSNVFAIPASFESSVTDPETGVGITVPDNAALVPTTFRLVVHTNELSERNLFVEIPTPEDWTAGLHIFRLESPQPVSGANLETSAFVIRSLNASPELDPVLIPPSGRDAWFVEYDIASSVSVGARDKVINRVATDFCPYGVNAHQEITEIGCYQKIAALATPRCGVDGTIAVCPTHRQPVIFIHGYQLKDGFKDIFEIQKNEQEKVWSEFPEILHHEGYAPYLFRWNTAQRFEDAARSLREVVDEVRSIHADAPPLIVAHSFGGLVARAYLHGADSVEASVPGPKEVLGLITVGTPHSGIATGGVFEFEGRKVRLPMGIDPDGRYRGVYDLALINSSFVVDQCEQISCYLAGRFIDIFSPRDRDLNPIPSLDMKAVFGVDSLPGGTIYRVNYGGSPMQVPLYALLGLQKEKGFGATNTAELKEGDGLISWQGQRIHPIMSCGPVGCENRPIPAAISMPEVFQGKITERVLGIAGDVTSSVVPGASVDWRSTEYRHSLGNQTWYSDGGRVQNVALVGVDTEPDRHEVLIEIRKTLGQFSDSLMNVDLADEGLCKEYGVCGIDFSTFEDLGWSDVRLSVQWGDGSAMNEGTVSGCMAAGYCALLSDGTLRVWHSYLPGTYQAVFTYAYGEGPSRETRVPVTVEGGRELALTTVAGDRRAVLDWLSLGADRHNLCRAQVPVADFDNCNVVGGQPIELDVGVPPLVIADLTNEETYYFRVEAQFGRLRILSKEVSATPKAAGVGPSIVESVVFVSEVDGAWDIFSVGVDGSNLFNLTETRANDRLPAVSLSIEKVAFVSDRDGSNDIYVMNMDGSGVTRLTENIFDEVLPVWSPDGNKIAFISQRGSGGGTYDIYVMDSDGGNLFRLTDSSSNDSQPHWSPDAEYIVFVSERDGADDIFIMKADGSGQTNLTKTSAKDTIPFFSPDGSRIAFVSDRDGDFDLWIMDVDGGNLVKLTSHETDAVGWYSWSPDGKLIAFDSMASGVYDIYVVDPVTGSIRQVTDSTASNRFASWTWYGSKIAYLSDEDGIYTINVVDPDGQGIVRLFEGAVQKVHLPAASPIYKEGGGENCFIATAAYGSYLDPRIAKLREFRDDHLLTTSWGKVFVSHYYRWSPPIADIVREHESLRVITRAILTPIVFGVQYPMQSTLILLLAGFVLVKRARRESSRKGKQVH